MLLYPVFLGLVLGLFDKIRPAHARACDNAVIERIKAQWRKNDIPSNVLHTYIKNSPVYTVATTKYYNENENEICCIEEYWTGTSMEATLTSNIYFRDWTSTALKKDMVEHFGDLYERDTQLHRYTIPLQGGFFGQYKCKEAPSFKGVSRAEGIIRATQEYKKETLKEAVVELENILGQKLSVVFSNNCDKCKKMTKNSRL